MVMYLGGKKMVRNDICAAIEKRRENRPFYDVFMGMGSIVGGMIGGERHGNDACRAIITMFEQYRAGWRPPDNVTREEWVELKRKQDHDNPLTAFVGFGCSYVGYWYTSYAANTKDRNFAATAGRGLAKLARDLEGVHLTSLDYLELQIPDGAIAFNDVPYGFTSKHNRYPGASKRFKYDEFLENARYNWRRRDIHVYLTEHVQPTAEWQEIWNRTLRKSKLMGQQTERLFVMD